MPENTIKLWELTTAIGAREIDLPDLSSLDKIARQLPQGYYSTFRTFDGAKRVLGLKAHLQRLYRPAITQHIKYSMDSINLRKSLVEILSTYKSEVRVRVIMTMQGQVYVAVEPLRPIPSELYLHGVKVVTTNIQRENPRLKSTTFISASQSTRTRVAGSEFYEALLVRNGSILEGMTSNFFYVKKGSLGTARNGILLGVTRQTVLRVTRGSGLDILYRPLKQEQVPALSEAFLTSSSRGIVPIVQIDAFVVGEGIPGHITKMLMERYNEYVMQHAEKI